MDQSELTVYFYDIFDASLPRLGPGDDSSTQKAIDLLRAAKPQRMNSPGSPGLRILDLCCGNGALAIRLTKSLDGAVVAVDNRFLPSPWQCEHFPLPASGMEKISTASQSGHRIFRPPSSPAAYTRGVLGKRYNENPLSSTVDVAIVFHRYSILPSRNVQLLSVARFQQ